MKNTLSQSVFLVHAQTINVLEVIQFCFCNFTAWVCIEMSGYLKWNWKNLSYWEIECMFHLNGFIVGFHLWTQSLDLDFIYVWNMINSKMLIYTGSGKEFSLESSHHRISCTVSNVRTTYHSCRKSVIWILHLHHGISSKDAKVRSTSHLTLFFTLRKWLVNPNSSRHSVLKRIEHQCDF